MTLALLWEALQAHDWFWMMTDDPRVSERGRAESRWLLEQAEDLGDEGRRMWAEFSAHYSVSGGNRPLPERPKES